MGKYMIKMNLIRSGQTLPDEIYDPLADMKAHSTLLKVRSPGLAPEYTLLTESQSQAEKKETYLSRAEIAELRRIEAERIEIGKRRVLGLDVPRNMGVRTEEVNPMTFE
jgi:hypothetical protein